MCNDTARSFSAILAYLLSPSQCAICLSKGYANKMKKMAWRTMGARPGLGYLHPTSPLVSTLYFVIKDLNAVNNETVFHYYFSYSLFIIVSYNIWPFSPLRTNSLLKGVGNELKTSSKQAKNGFENWTSGRVIISDYYSSLFLTVSLLLLTLSHYIRLFSPLRTYSLLKTA